MARLAGFEPATLGLEGRCSIQMSYRRRIYTCLFQHTHFVGMPYCVVGVERFELPTSCSQSRRATRLRYTPIFFIKLFLLNWTYSCFLSPKQARYPKPSAWALYPDIHQKNRVILGGREAGNVTLCSIYGQDRIYSKTGFLLVVTVFYMRKSALQNQQKIPCLPKLLTEKR